MAFFTYEAINKDGETVFGDINASNQEEVVGMLSRKRLTPVRIEIKQLKASGFAQANISFERFTALDRIILVRNLATTVKAGLSILESIEILIADATKNITRQILTSARGNIQNGQSLSKTFEDNEKYFPAIFVGMIRAGELSGQLDRTLDELTRNLVKEYDLVKKVKSALAYPVILLVASAGIVGLLLTFVLPKLIKTFTQNRVELPLSTKILVAASNALTYSYLLDLAVIVALGFGLMFLRKSRPGQRALSWLSFKLPVVRNLIKKIILVRFTRILGSLLSSALPIEEALLLSANSLGNHLYREAIEESVREIKNGLPLSESLRKTPDLFPHFLTSLVAVGEKTGTLDEVLKTFADFYEDDVDGALKDLTTFLEPMMLLIMGLIVGGIALSVLMPIYKLVGNFV